MSWETNLKKYLEFETIFNQFFRELDFCGNHCVNKEISNYKPEKKGREVEIPGRFGCCPIDFHKMHEQWPPSGALILLKHRRIKKYGEPLNSEEILGFGMACGYHTSVGCILKTHKQPNCLSYLCKEGVQYLKNNFGVMYYPDSNLFFLENVLAGKITPGWVPEKKKQHLQKIIEQVRETKS